MYTPWFSMEPWHGQKASGLVAGVGMESDHPGQAPAAGLNGGLLQPQPYLLGHHLHSITSKPVSTSLEGYEWLFI